MKWISLQDQLPPNESILVFGICGMPHVTVYDYGGHCHTECCYPNGGHFIGESIQFTHWMPLPDVPDKNVASDNKEPQEAAHPED